MLQTLVDSVVYQIEEYRRNQFEILGIVGINRSPSCGVETTSADGIEAEGSGVFLEALKQENARRNWNIPVLGIKDSEPEKTLETITRLLKKE
ncbi:MAG: DUF523 domain-containing protein [Eubacteriales bacterium]|nr:DUF523 domain-containing protein [Eubacteriales bacterium]